MANTSIGFDVRVLGLLADLHRRQLPHRARIILRDPGWLVALEPAEEAGLVLPEVIRASENAAVLGPDKLLVDEGAERLPNALDHRLPSAGVPAVPGGVGQDGVLDGLADKTFVELGALAGVVPGHCIGFGPLLILVRPALLRRMVGAVVADEIRRITCEQDRLLVVHDANERQLRWCYRRRAAGDRPKATDRPAATPGWPVARG